ncbi:hypothetical protein [Cloacibacillus evryensis]|uniref:hypothetical protein n=1 Tax=Cloacibacillus evryensis TaxID=508460 RepID=UPI00210F1BB8|nr:hypothetical protein [Cloacibacillus evryensis]MCQ4763264.1 hypothetical protein [Cloacibacillus evryensis]
MRRDDYKGAVKVLHEIEANPSRYMVIHYSCENFYDRTDGRSPRITSIAIRNYDTGQTVSFSIQKEAEVSGVDFESITENYNVLEKEMLKKYFSYISHHQDTIWLHWNMRDENYGFGALEHRYKVLCHGTAKGLYVIQDANKLDVARLMIKKYSVGYIGHPRLPSLLKKNHINAKDFLTGEEEALAFEEHNYIRLHQSTLRKVDVIANIIQRAANDRLLVNSSFREIHGTDIEGLRQWLTSTTYGIFGLWLTGTVAGAILTHLVDKYLFFAK